MSKTDVEGEGYLQRKEGGLRERREEGMRKRREGEVRERRRKEQRKGRMARGVEGGHRRIICNDTPSSSSLPPLPQS